MNNKRYKDLQATGILLGIIGIFGLIFVVSYYATQQMKENFLLGLLSCCVLGFVWAVWKLIRALID
jgi:hypothetical protein